MSHGPRLIARGAVSGSAALTDFAIDSHEVHGVWGGTSEEERRVIAAQRGELERLPA
jgi:hypothetical protein